MKGKFIGESMAGFNDELIRKILNNETIPPVSMKKECKQYDKQYFYKQSKARHGFS